MIAVPGSALPSTKSGDIHYFYADAFVDFGRSWNKVVSELKANATTGCAPTIPQGTFTDACGLVAAFWAMRLLNGFPHYEGIFYFRNPSL